MSAHDEEQSLEQRQRFESECQRVVSTLCEKKQTWHEMCFPSPGLSVTQNNSRHTEEEWAL